MKNRIQCTLTIRRSVATMLALSIAITQWGVISQGSSAVALIVKTKPSATYQPDDVDEMVQAAKAGISTLDASNVALIAKATVAFDALSAAAAQQQNDLAAIAAQIQGLIEEIEALRAQMNAVRNQIENLAQKLDEIKAKAGALEQCTAMKGLLTQEYDKLITQVKARIAEAEAKNQPTTAFKEELLTLQNKSAEALKKLEAACASVLSQIGTLEDQVQKTAKVRRVLARVSADPTKASQFVQLIKSNNRTGLSEFLHREAGGGDFAISDANVVSGPLVAFRVDSISHCLSVGSQCNGKSYLLTR